jgi:hypothetical protein
MSFLTPLFLLGLAGLAIPVLLHLIQRERRQIVAFPSLMFLRRIPYQSVQRRRIRNWLLLLMRLAALALIVLAFGRPFFRGTDPAVVAAGGAREVVILIDRSYSMGYGDRWGRALNAARHAVDGMGPVDRASIVFFGASTDVALRSTSDKGRLYSALTGSELSAGGTRYGPVLKLAGSILAESTLPRREVVLVSDFQRVGWQGGDGVRLPDGTVLTPVVIGDADVTNLSVTPVAIERSSFANQERVTVTAGVTNHGAGAASTTVALEINGRAIQTLEVRAEPQSSASTSFAPVTVTDEEVRATVRLGDDALEPDNAFHFVVAAGRPVRTLLVERAAGREAPYLARALAVGDAPRFDTLVRPAEAVSAEDLQAAALVVVNDVQVSSTLASRLTAFVERGGGLLVIAGQRGTWPQGGGSPMPGLPGEMVDRSRGQAARLVALEYGHPVFEPFRAPRSGDFSAARFYGYRALTVDPEAAVLARFDDGAPALVERRLGAGRVLVWAASVDVEWNDFPAAAGVPALRPPGRAAPVRLSPAGAVADGRRRAGPLDPDGHAGVGGSHGGDPVGAAGVARSGRGRRAHARGAGLLRAARARNGRGRAGGHDRRERRPDRVGPDADGPSGDGGGGHGWCGQLRGRGGRLRAVRRHARSDAAVLVVPAVRRGDPVVGRDAGVEQNGDAGVEYRCVNSQPPTPNSQGRAARCVGSARLGVGSWTLGVDNVTGSDAG